MKVNQISEILNDVFGEILGEDNLLAEDLGDIVGKGQVITSSTDFGDNFENYAGKIVDKVGKVVFVSRVYKSQDLGLWRDNFEYGSVLEKIRVEVGEYEPNAEWNLRDRDEDGDSDYNDGIINAGGAVERLFKFYPAKVRAKYFNLKTTFRSTVSIAQKQLKSAFRSASDMARFIGMIEQRIATKMEIAKDQLQRRTLANFIGERIYGEGAQLVDLKTEYAKILPVGQSAPATLEAALSDKEFVRFMAKRITQDRKLMTSPSNVYSGLDSGFYNFTPEEDARLIVLQDVDAALAFNLYGDTYNKEFVTLTGYKAIPFWQGTGTDMDIEARSGLNIITTEDHSITRSDIVGILFDRDAIMICNEDPEVTSQYNADGNFTNFFYNADCSYYNDFDENGIVYVYGDGSGVETGTGNITASVAATTGAGGTNKVTVTFTAPTGASATWVKSADNIGQYTEGATLTTTDYTSATSGSTAVTTAVGKYIDFVSVDSNGKIVGYTSVKVTAVGAGS